MVLLRVLFFQLQFLVYRPCCFFQHDFHSRNGHICLLRKGTEKALDIEISQKNKARYQYQQLKHQLNPHFLFNSLTPLDYLIRTDAGKASEYVRKLASLYRHFLNIGEQESIMLKEELEFVELYVDLLSQRFDNSLKVTFKISEEYLTGAGNPM